MDTGADEFAGPLVAADVKQTYGIVGSSLTGLTNARPCQDKIEWAKARHEAATSFGKNFQLIRRRFATLAGIAAIPLVLPPAGTAADREDRDEPTPRLPRARYGYRGRSRRFPSIETSNREKESGA
jgi:hypothetical protein